MFSRWAEQGTQARRLVHRLRARQSGLAEGHIRITPDLVVEVLSPTDLEREVSRRLLDYLRAGVRLLWVINPEARLVQVYRPGRRGVIRPEIDHLEGAEVLAGFRVPVQALFRPLALRQPESALPVWSQAWSRASRQQCC